MRIAVAFIAVLACGAWAVAAEEGPRVFQDEPADVAREREGAWQRDKEFEAQVRGDAEKALRGGPYAVTDKKHPIPGMDLHDYVSLAPYYWPDPKKADGLPYINRDGHRNPEIREYDAEPFGAMSGRVYSLALGYYFTGEEKYAERAALLMRVWFVDPKTRMNPNLDHAQMVRGHDEGRPTGIIESLRLMGVVDGVGLLHGSKAWTDADQKAMEKWFGDYQRWMLESKNGKGEDNAKNNHGSWYDVQVVTFALFLGDRETARRVCEAAKTRRIAPQIEPDGRMPLETRRANSFHYSIYDVRALTELADLAKRVDVDLWHFETADHRSVRGAVDYLMPFATGETKWPFPEIGNLLGADMLGPIRRAEAALGGSERIGRVDETSSLKTKLLEAHTSWGTISLPRRSGRNWRLPRANLEWGRTARGSSNKSLRVWPIKTASFHSACDIAKDSAPSSPSDRG